MDFGLIFILILNTMDFGAIFILILYTGVLRNSQRNSIHPKFWCSFHPKAIHSGLSPNFRSNTVDNGFLA